MTTKTVYCLFWAAMLLGCNRFTKRQVEAKNACIERNLPALRTKPVYAAIMRAFNDTFPVLKATPANFGRPDHSECRVDDAVFLNADEDRCLLLVSTRYTDGPGFGSTRVVQGHSSVRGWKFLLDRQFGYEDSYNARYGGNQFENVEMVGRYFVLVLGKNRGFSCKIDESYWFERDIQPWQAVPKFEIESGKEP